MCQQQHKTSEDSSEGPRAAANTLILTKVFQKVNFGDLEERLVTWERHLYIFRFEWAAVQHGALPPKVHSRHWLSSQAPTGLLIGLHIAGYFLEATVKVPVHLKVRSKTALASRSPNCLHQSSHGLTWTPAARKQASLWTGGMGKSLHPPLFLQWARRWC